LLLARRYVRPSLFGLPRHLPLWTLGTPLFISSVFFGFYTRLDLVALKRLGAATEDVGIYGAAHSLALLPSVFTLAFMPLLLATLSRLLTRGEVGAAKEIGVNALRGVVALMPIAAAVAGSAGEIVSMFFGPAFDSGGPVLAILIIGSFSLLVVPVASAILIALGKPARTPWLTVPLVPLAFVGHVAVIPYYGAIGAAAVTTCVALFGTASALWCTRQVWQIVPPPATIVRSLLVSVTAFLLAAMWPAPGFLVLFKLPVVVATCVVLFIVLGEFTFDEFAMTGSLLTRERS
jgi:O-antigen/teichoic acid export membrane protein